jgi:D-alanyl-lipoteichoic acid acyltransferase DltB (MBOAT superfamily)
MQIKETPILLLLLFTLIYSTLGDPNNEIWSGSYFVVNYLIMFLLFKTQKSNVNRIAGMSLSISILIYIGFKYFIGYDFKRYFTLGTFLITVIVILIKERHAYNNR